MKDYDGIFIIRPELSQEEAEALAKAIEETITQNEGKIKESSNWGKRQLTYRIEGCSEGYYRLIQFEIPPANLAKLERTHRLNEKILRALITKK